MFIPDSRVIDSSVRTSKKDLPVLLINDVIGQLDITAHTA